VNANDLRARVIVEGANLGMTQRGRVEYALTGGLINTDAIDNSGGVDCSDHEVNIKILFNSMAVPISREDRDQLLKVMTDDVASLVLQDNYRQSQILSILQKRSYEDLSSYQSLIKILETEVGLNPALEYLPDDETLERRRQKHMGLTRPELAVLLAYSKIALYRQIVDSHLVDDEKYKKYLLNYFPELLQQKFADAIAQHPLKKEIIATVLANTLINRVGPIFVYDLAGTTGFSIPQIVHGFFSITDVLIFEPVWQNIDKLDPLMRTDLQAHAFLEISQVIRTAVLWLLYRTPYTMNPKAVAEVIQNLASLVEGDQQQLLGHKILSFHDAGLPHTLAEELAVLPYYPTALDVAYLVNESKNLIPTAVVYFSLRAQFGFDWLNQQTQELLIDAEWKKGAQIGLMDDLSSILTALTDRVMQSAATPNLKKWMDHNQSLIVQVNQIMQLLKSAVRPDFGQISYGVRQLQRLIGVS
jgi:glutamate dehydrogenase